MNLSPGTVEILIGAGFTRDELEEIFSRRVWQMGSVPAPAPTTASAMRVKRNARIVALWCEDVTIDEIAQEVGISRDMVYKIAQRLKLGRRPRLTKRAA